jgi:hypothetical protein
MFGYIKPARSELKVRELERFQSVYCGLCHAIQKEYGMFHTLFLSFDSTFLALVLDSFEEACETCHKRCIASLWRKKCVAAQNKSLDYAAAVNVILTYEKLEDSICDEKGWKRLAAKLLKGLCHSGYQKARGKLPDFAKETAFQLAELRKLEQEKTASLDRPADTFSQILKAAVPKTGDSKERILQQFFYHIGRYIYLVDACYDIKDDFESGNYNPILLRYQLENPELAPIRDSLELTIANSVGAISAAYQLLELKKDAGIIENVIFLGMPLVLKEVLNGTYLNNGGKISHGSL